MTDAVEFSKQSPWRGHAHDRYLQIVALREYLAAWVEQKTIAALDEQIAALGERRNAAYDRRDGHLAVTRGLRFGQDEITTLVAWHREHEETVHSPAASYVTWRLGGDGDSLAYVTDADRLAAWKPLDDERLRRRLG